MRQQLMIVLWAVFSVDLGIGANNIVLNCPCQLKSSCFKPLNISSVNETSCVDDNFVRCCGESDQQHVKQIVVVVSTTSSVSNQTGNLSVVFPSEMSGIPQTTPSNMPDDYMIQMVDKQSGNEMLLVFPKQEKTSEEEPTTTTSTTSAPSTTTTTVKATTAQSTKTKPKPVKRRKIKVNRQQGEPKNGLPKPNTKIFDASRRKNFLRRHPDSPLEIVDSALPLTTTTHSPVALHHFNDELRIKVDEEHKAMIINLKALLTVANVDKSPTRQPLDTGKNHRFEKLVNVEMKKAIDNMKIKKKPYRGKIKYQDYKWAAIPDTHQEQQTPSRTVNRKPTTTKPSTTTSKPNFYNAPLPYREFVNRPTLLADFKPSRLWSLSAENIDVTEFNTRSPRKYITSSNDYFGSESGFTPVVHNGESLQIVGPVPRGFTSRVDDTRLSYELPVETVNYF